MADPIINSLYDVENFLQLTGSMADLPTMERRGVSVKACVEIAEFASMVYVTHSISENKVPDINDIMGFVASFSMMLGIELERRHVLNEDE